ncbi:MAG TPA: DUF327 family protein [Candidatus Wallbacteria bacterium]|nr:DUF327 family protein [Candidatus Wallbacteria bacterium]
MAIKVPKSSSSTGGISEKNRQASGTSSKGAAGGAGGSSGAGISAVSQSFSAAFDGAERTFNVQEIRRMINDLDVHIQSLKKNPTFKEFETYRDKIKAILNEISTKLYKKETRELSLPGGKSKKLISMITRVDEVLKDIEEEFNKKVDIDLLATHYEIKGILLDIAS